MISVLSGFVPTVFIDYRPLQGGLINLASVAGSVTKLPLRTHSQLSISCLHVLEHIGLGRYGDPMNPDGTRQAAIEIQRILAPGGSLYLSLPIGRERVCFNAHRVHHADTVRNLFSELVLKSFSLVDDLGRFHNQADFQYASAQDYGCGLFEFERSNA